MLKIVIFMEPVGKQRARAGRTRGKDSENQKIIHYTPDKTAHAENLIRDKVMEAMKDKYPDVTALIMVAEFYRTRPKKPKNPDRPVTTPDWDNYGKLLSDALNKFLYNDDAQLSTVLVKKRYAMPGQMPRIELKIWEDTEEWILVKAGGRND